MSAMLRFSNHLTRRGIQGLCEHLHLGVRIRSLPWGIPLQILGQDCGIVLVGAMVKFSLIP